MDCRIALRGAISGRFSTQPDKKMKPSGPIDLANVRYCICTSGFFARGAGRHAGSTATALSDFSKA
jgi:hypothetical protein